MVAAIEGALDALGDAKGGAEVDVIAECDIIDQRPLLCVAGESANVHTSEAVLTIDQGGNDTYRSTAGGRPSHCGDTDPFCRVNVVIDLAGDDVYEPDDPRWSLGTGAQSIGVLVDAGGNDRYSAQATECPASAGGILTCVQSQGAALGGLGLLADLGGDDEYVMSTVRGNAQGQGVGAIGVGVLYDASGDDRYVASKPATVAVELIWAQGMAALGGVGVLADGGGANLFSVESTGSGTAGTASQGVAVGGGTGLLLSGPGNDVFRAHFETEAGPQTPRGGAGLLVQGAASIGGTGVLDDTGGDDVYSARLAHRKVVTERRETECNCDKASANTSGPDGASFESMRVVAQGAGYGYGTGMLNDVAGDDHYVAATDLSLVATAVDPRDGGSATASSDVGTYFSQAYTVAMGAVRGGGSGVLTDLGGDDMYSLTSHARSIATAETGPGGVALASAASPTVEVNGLGGSLGVFRDDGGEDDYEVVAISRAQAHGTGARMERNRVARVNVLGSQGGVHVDTDAGDLDTYTVLPERGVTVGARGQSPNWHDSGLGLNATARPKTPCELQIDLANDPVDANTVAVMTLTCEGTPMPGREIAVDIQERVELEGLPWGSPVLLDDTRFAVTDEQGVARVRLNEELWRDPPLATFYRAAAHFSGDRALRNAHAEVDLQ